MNDEIKNKLKIKMAISKMKNEEEKNMNRTGKFIFKNIGIAACTLMVLTGGVFAASKVIENIWKTPEKIENVTEQITEESKKENITEDQAKEIAINKLEQIGFNTNIVGTNHYKEMDSDTIIYRFNTEDNYEMSINGKTGEFETIWNLNENQQDRNIEITEDEAIQIANEYYTLFGFKEGEYEITKIYCNNTRGSGTDSGYKIDITYNKKYGEIYNPYEMISISVESKNKNFDSFTVENMPFDNNEIIITKDEAIQIALEEDKKIETNKVVETKAERRIVKMNADAYERINNKEEYYDAMQTVDYPNEDRNYYNVEDKIRNAWVVVITYEDNFDSVTERYTEGKYSYFVDCTTGEIIGGYTMDYTLSN